MEICSSGSDELVEGILDNGLVDEALLSQEVVKMLE